MSRERSVKGRVYDAPAAANAVSVLRHPGTLARAPWSVPALPRLPKPNHDHITYIMAGESNNDTGAGRAEPDFAQVGKLYRNNTLLLMCDRQ